MASEDKWGEKNEKKKENTSLILTENVQWRGESNSRERKSNFSLDFPVFGLSDFVGPRNKVVLRCKGYTWASFLWSFKSSER